MQTKKADKRVVDRATLRTSFLKASFAFLFVAALSISVGLLNWFDISFEEGRLFFFIFLSFSVFTFIFSLFAQKEFLKQQGLYPCF